MSSRSNRYAAFAGLFVLLAITLFAYRITLPGFFLFDEWPNLAGLADVSDIRSAASFVFSGDAGPLGRPLALATFVIQVEAWPSNPSPFLSLNFAIHLLATVAAFALATGLARVRTTAQSKAPLWIGLGVASLWALSPFLATTHLMIIQRMASLSGLFVLTGLAAFVWAHLLSDRQPHQRRILLFVALGIGTPLAALSKESGTLLPLLAVVILWTWIPKERWLQSGVDRTLIWLLAYLPAFLVLAYLAHRLPGTLENGYGAHRYFSPYERLMSQPAILLDYLRNLLLPRASAISPFMDNLPAPRGWLDPPITLIAAAFWAGLAGVAIWLRRTAPYLLFALAFFLVAHLLESTFLSLELYFSHRNYVPAFAVYFLIVFGVSRLTAEHRRIAIGGLIAYIALFAVILIQTTSTWTESVEQGELWLEQNPHSERAAQFLADKYLRESDFAGARHVLVESSRENPELAMLQVQKTGICIGREHAFPELFDSALEALRSARFQPLAAHELARAANDGPATLCPPRDHSAIIRLAEALLENPQFARSSAARYYLFIAKAISYASNDDLEPAANYYLQAFESSPQLENLFLGVSLIANMGDYDRAFSLIEAARSKAPGSKRTRQDWLERLEGFRYIIAESQRLDSEAQDEAH